MGNQLLTFMSKATVRITSQLRSHLDKKAIPPTAVKRLAQASFPDCDQITLSLLSTAGFSRAAVIMVRGRQRSGIPIQPQVLKVGPRGLIQAELRRFRRCVLNVLKGVPAQTRTAPNYRNWTALPYWQIGDHISVRTLRALYAQESAEAIVAVCQRLFDGVMEPWLRAFTSRERHIFKDRSNCFGFSKEAMEDIRRAAGIISAPTNPVEQWKALVGADKRPALVYECIIHGDLNSGNVLVDRWLQPWLIDFAHTGRGHYLRDLAKLEAEVKFLLMDCEAGHDRIPQWLELDRVLDDRWPFGQVPPAGIMADCDEELAKAFVVISGLRSLAKDRMIGPKRPQIAQYRAALLHYTLRAMAYEDVSVAKKEYAFLSASRLGEFKYDF
jgi:hypothetical protein